MADHRPVGFGELARGQRSGLEPHEAGIRVADGAAAWESLWSDHARGEPPNADHREAWVGLVLLGERPTGGYAVAVDEVLGASGRYVVRAVEDEPDPGAIVTQALTYPWVAVAVERGAGAPEDVDLVLEGS